MDDGSIVGLYWDRNEEALAHSESVYGAYCRTIANNLLHDAEDAKECLNDALLAAWNSIPRLRREERRVCPRNAPTC